MSNSQTFTPTSWIANKTIDHVRVQQLLSTCDNQFTDDGPLTEYLESLVRQLLEVESKKCVIVCNNATSGLHALMASMEFYSNDRSITSDNSQDYNIYQTYTPDYQPGKWLTQDFTSPSSAQGPLYQSIDIIDIDPIAGGINLNILNNVIDTGDHHAISGIICTNMFGNVVDIDVYQDWCYRAGNKWFIMDNSSTPYSFYKGRNSVNYGNGSVVSFHHNNPIGFGEGGVIIADIELEQTIRRIINFGIDNNKNKPWIAIGGNYKMNNIAAAYIIQYLECNFENILKHHTTIYNQFLTYADNNNIQLYPNFADIPHLDTEYIDNPTTEDDRLSPPPFSDKYITHTRGIIPSCLFMLDDTFTINYINEVSNMYGIHLKKKYKPLTGKPNAVSVYNKALCHPLHLDMKHIQLPNPALVIPLDPKLNPIQLNYYRLSDKIPSYIKWPDIYYTPEYGRVSEESYPGTIWECCIGSVNKSVTSIIPAANSTDTNYIQTDTTNEIYYIVHCYLLRPTDKPSNIYLDTCLPTDQYYDLITPAGYLGPTGSPQMMRYLSEQYNQLFKENAIKRGYITQVIRRSPYLTPQPIISTQCHRIATKNTYIINMSRFESINDYISVAGKSQKRAIKRAQKAKLQFSIQQFKYEWEEGTLAQQLIQIYTSTIKRVTNNTAYQFNDAYFNYLGQLSEKYPESVMLATVSLPSITPNIPNQPIAMAIILGWPKPVKYIHYHLGGYISEYADYSPMNYLYYKVIEIFLNMKDNQPHMFHLGGGIATGDSLEQLHSKIVPEQQLPLTYTIYGEVFNEPIYQALETEYVKTVSTHTLYNTPSHTKLSYRKRAKKYKYFPVYKEHDHGV